jgi:hypothetical protein
MKGRPWIHVYVGIAVFICGMAAINLALPAAVAKAIVPVFVLLSLAGYGAFLYRTFRPRKTTLDVAGDRLVVDEGRGGTFPLSGALLGLWRMPAVGVTAGTVLHLQSAAGPFDGGGSAPGPRTFCVAGRDHVPPAGIRLEAPMVEGVDAFLSAADFDALLAALPSWGVQARREEPAAPAPRRIPLLPNPSSGRSAFAMMLPWFGTMALVSLLGGGLGALGLFDSPVGQAIGTALIVSILVGGIVLTVLRARRRAPGLEIEIDSREFRLRDPQKGTVLAATPISMIQAVPAMYSYTGRVSFEHAVLTLRLSPTDEVALAVYDTRYRWRDPVPHVSAPRWIVGPPDWNVLLDLFGARRLAVVQSDGYTP